MKKKIFFSIAVAFAFIILILGGVYMLGPRAPKPDLSTEIEPVQGGLEEVSLWIEKQEAKVEGLKPDNEARIVWADSVYQKTPYSVVYLHGFSASQGEGDPIHKAFAKRYGCNLYLSRLASHGVDEAEPMLNMTPESLLASAKEAIAIAQKLGDKVIVMSTSTGGTLALYLASGSTDFAGLICYSPNIDIYDPSAKLLVGPWGLQMARWVVGSKYREVESTPEEKKYWISRYRIEALVALKSLVDATMKEEVFSKITAPVFVGYYYKSEEAQDQVVSVPRILEMYEQLGTPEVKKRKVAFPNVSNHVIASKYVSQDIESVRKATYDFAEEILGLQPLASSDTLP